MDSDLVVQSYRAIPASRLRSVLLVEYRCVRGCLLLHVWQSPAGAMYYRPPGPLPDYSGLGAGVRLPAHAGLVSDFSTAGPPPLRWAVTDSALGVYPDRLVLGCGHAWGACAASDFATDAAAAEPGQPIVRHDLWGKPESPKSRK